MLLLWDGLGVATVGWIGCCYCGMDYALNLWDGLGI